MKKTDHLLRTGVCHVYKLLLFISFPQTLWGPWLSFLHPDQVQQRGVVATQEIILKLLDGLPLSDAQPVLVVDCLPNRNSV